MVRPGQLRVQHLTQLRHHRALKYFYAQSNNF